MEQMLAQAAQPLARSSFPVFQLGPPPALRTATPPGKSLQPTSVEAAGAPVRGGAEGLLQQDSAAAAPDQPPASQAAPRVDPGDGEGQQWAQQRREEPLKRAPSAQVSWPGPPGKRLGAGRDPLVPAGDPPGQEQGTQPSRGEEAGGTPPGCATARLSAKLESAGPGDLGGEGLRGDLAQAMGGPDNVLRMEGAARPGCVHIVVDALLLQV